MNKVMEPENLIKQGYKKERVIKKQEERKGGKEKKPNGRSRNIRDFLALIRIPCKGRSFIKRTRRRRKSRKL